MRSLFRKESFPICFFADSDLNSPPEVVSAATADDAAVDIDGRRNVIDDAAGGTSWKADDDHGADDATTEPRRHAVDVDSRTIVVKITTLFFFGWGMIGFLSFSFLIYLPIRRLLFRPATSCFVASWVIV
jgi:hypothetical protein